MRFAEYLTAEAVPEWQKKYVNYSALKKALDKIPRHNGSILNLSGSTSSVRLRNRKRGNDSNHSINSESDELPTLIPAGHSLPGVRGNRRTSVRLSVNMLEQHERSRRSSMASERLDHASRRQSSRSPRPSLNSQRRPSSVSRPATPAQGVSRRSSVAPSVPGNSPGHLQIPQISPKLEVNHGGTLEDGSCGELPLDPRTIREDMERLIPEERTFFKLLERELEKVGNFYNELEVRLQSRFKVLQDQCAHYQSLRKNMRRRSSMFGEPAGASGNLLTRLLPGNWGDQNSATQTTGQAYTTDRQRASYYNPRESMDPAQLLNSSYRSSKAKLKKALFELYHGTELAKNFRILNYTGFMQILSKYDRVGQWQDGSEFYKFYVENHQFVQSRTLDNMLKDIENLYIEVFAGGDRHRGLKKLRVPDNRFTTYHSAALICGVFGGMLIPMLVYILWMIHVPEVWLSLPYMASMLKVYGGIFLMDLMVVLLGVNMYIWGRNRINYKFIYGFDPRNNLNWLQFMELPLFNIIMTSAFICISISNPFYKSIPNYAYPATLMVCKVILLLFPLKIMHFSARMWFVNNIKRLLLTPLLPVKFKDFFLADQLNSLQFWFGSMYMMGCAYNHDWTGLSKNCKINYTWLYPALLGLPSYWRSLQCLRRAIFDGRVRRNMANSLKYFLVTVVYWLTTLYKIHPTSGNRALWIIFATISCVYSFAWDVFMDWGMIEFDKYHPRLRKERKYRWTWAYYFAIVSNFIMRFGWTASLTATYFKISDPNHYDLIYFIASLNDVLRRFLWNVFRMENEHVNNCGLFRATKDVPLPYELSYSTADSTTNTYISSDVNTLHDYTTVFDSNPTESTDQRRGPNTHSWAETVQTTVQGSPNTAPKRPTSVVINLPE
ncbi:Xenotropic and polytropic retrovirus receptor 1 [Dispira simplex]|nr:Xenotropic and polytropic retrovirus receptor 1 [Dispira simplex]